jgi:hypothetical protein
VLYGGADPDCFIQTPGAVVMDCINTGCRLTRDVIRAG